jgi:hypothetical protein
MGLCPPDSSTPHEMQKTNSILKNSCIEQNEMKISELSKMIEVPSKILSL